MRRYEVLEHTADVGLRAWGTTLEQLFENAAAGMMDIAVEAAGIVRQETKIVRAAAADRESLLVGFLDELLWLVDGEGWLPGEVRVTSLDDRTIAAEAGGEPRDAQRHNLRLIIKAVTYHLLAVRKTSAGWEAEVYFDI